jgi:uncharacterized protein (DUF427 family)
MGILAISDLHTPRQERRRFRRILARAAPGVTRALRRINPIWEQEQEPAMSAPIKTPGPDHPIIITTNPRRVRISAGGTVIAETTRALTLREASYPPVRYIPREDADMRRLQRSDHRSYCPYKGEAGYFSIVSDGRTLANAVWTYETPYDAVKAIAGHLAFYPDKVTIEEI